MSTGCSDLTPPVSDSCQDPAYRAAHPDECALATILILQPDYALTEPGKTVAYTVILRANGVEVTLEQGLEFSSSNVGAAVINEDGVATGVTAGSTTISVTWQNLSAHAQLDVVGSCAETNQHFAILIDNSKSMGQAFSSAYATKLSFSKSVAADFLQTVNTSKDDFAIFSFADDPEQHYDGEDFGTNVTAGRAAVNSISLSTEKTDMASALEQVIDTFPEDGVRVLVIFTDGEWTGDDPLPIAQAFRESGGFLVVVATESWGEFFADMAEMASGGFLLSAYDDTEEDMLPTLSGLKSFICSGSCSPEAGTSPTAALNYDGFINWNVTAGRVDLCGLGLWDVQPGNGLYVDLQGSGSAGVPPPGEDFGLGQITSKVDYEFENGKQYRFTLDVGGSSRGAGTWTIRVRVGDGVDETITISDAATPLTPHEFEWTQSGDFTGPIIIEQTVQTGHHNVGTLIDDILLENVTDVEVMLDDDFNSENPQVTPPNPGGYSYGCAESPPGAQQASPEPPTPRIEE